MSRGIDTQINVIEQRNQKKSPKSICLINFFTKVYKQSNSRGKIAFSTNDIGATRYK